MAVDEALLDQVASASTMPTLRLYGWTPPCLSLGYFQRIEIIDPEACRRLGVDVVRRPTGGRAILHDAELTYSVILPAGVLGHEAGIMPSYYRISRALRGGLALLGVETTSAPEARARPAAQEGAACFDHPSAHEILLNGRKLVGSAQVRRGAAILQHGSILVEPRTDRLVACLNTSSRGLSIDSDRLASSVAGLAEVGLTSIKRLAVAIAAGFEQEFGIKLLQSTLSATEREAAGCLVSKYRAPEWTAGPAVMAENSTRTR